jgi:hypothetical protein
VAGGVSAGPAAADPGGDGGFTFAVIGDIPYGDAQIARFPAVVDQINADPSVRFVDHLGDIKSGSSRCDDAYYAMIRTQFDRFSDPLVYTPGDNEWTDCHRPNNGSYDPLERLDAVRSTFFTRPGKTLGEHSVAVHSHAAQGYPENVRYTRAGVVFAAIHVVGSDNSLLPWTGHTAPTPAQIAEEQGRTADVLALLDESFAQAQADDAKAVVLLTQADMFDPTVSDPQHSDYDAFAPLVHAIADHARDSGRPVYLFNGDSHVYNADHPLGTGSPWLAFYGVDTAVPNLQRVTVDGSTGVNDYLRVTVGSDPADPLSWTKVPFTS